MAMFTPAPRCSKLGCNAPLGSRCSLPDCPNGYAPLKVSDIQPSDYKSIAPAISIKPQAKIGWVCPVCGRGVAPHLDRCPCP